MSKRATNFAADKFPFRYDTHGDVINFEQTILLQGVCRIGYMQAEQNIISIIESRISEIIGDAQPKPVLRMELQDLIRRIKEE